MLIRRISSAALRFAKQAVSSSTLPLTQSSVAKTSRNIWGATKNFAASAIGKGAPLYDRAASIQNLSWDRKRGTIVNPNYENDGRLVLSLRDGVIRERSLQMLEALDNSEIGALDPSSKGLQGGISGALKHEQDYAQCKQLLALRRTLEEHAGSLSVERSSDGFSRVLKITIDTSNKSVEDVQKEIEDVFGALGVGSPELARSIAKELIHERDTGVGKSNLVSQTHSGNQRGEPAHGPAPAQDEQPGQGRSGARRGRSPALDRDSQSAGEDIVTAEQSVDPAAMDDCVAESFSMSRGAPYASTGSATVDHIAQQTQFLERTDRHAGELVLQRQGVDLEALRNAAVGLSDVSHDQSPQGVQGDSPYVTPATQAGRGSTQGKSM